VEYLREQHVVLELVQLMFCFVTLQEVLFWQL